MVDIATNYWLSVSCYVGQHTYLLIYQLTVDSVDGCTYQLSINQPSSDISFDVPAQNTYNKHDPTFQQKENLALSGSLRVVLSQNGFGLSFPSNVKFSKNYNNSIFYLRNNKGMFMKIKVIMWQDSQVL